MTSPKIKWTRTETGYKSDCGRFEIVRDTVAGSNNGCWKPCCHLIDSTGKYSERHIERIGWAKETAQQILDDGE